MKNLNLFILNYLPWLLSCIAIYSNILIGDKNRNAWAVSIASQFLWLIWIVCSANWGFLPLNIALWWVYIRNHLKWTRIKPESSHRTGGLE